MYKCIHVYTREFFLYHSLLFQNCLKKRVKMKRWSRIFKCLIICWMRIRLFWLQFWAFAKFFCSHMKACLFCFHANCTLQKLHLSRDKTPGKREIVHTISICDWKAVLVLSCLTTWHGHSCHRGNGMVYIWADLAASHDNRCAHVQSLCWSTCLQLSMPT